MIWQDVVLTIGCLGFTLAALPMLRRGSQVSRISSVPTTLMLFVFAWCYATLDLWWTAGAEFLMAMTWLAVAIFRPLRPCKVQDLGDT